LVIKEDFWAGIESDALSPERVEHFELGQELLQFIAYRSGAKVGDALHILHKLSVSSMRCLFEELFYFHSSDFDDDEYECDNAYQTIMEINRSVGDNANISGPSTYG
jgi:hypothetical protein